MAHPHIIRRGTAKSVAQLVAAIQPVEVVEVVEVAPVLAAGSLHSIAPPGRAYSTRASSCVGPDGLSASTMIDVMVFVFARSELRTLVGTDALRTVLHGSSGALFPEAGTLALQPVWELLESQPGFMPDRAAAPMCRLKILENTFGLTVTMPTALAAIDRATCEEHATRCQLADHELDKLVRPPAKRPTTVIELVAFEPPVQKRSPRVALAFVAALIGLGTAGFSAYHTFSGDREARGNFESLSAAEISSEIPLLEVRKSGDALVATLADPTWSQKPEATRKLQLEAAAANVRAAGAVSLVILDIDGSPAGSLSLEGGPAAFVPPAR